MAEQSQCTGGNGEAADMVTYHVGYGRNMGALPQWTKSMALINRAGPRPTAACHAGRREQYSGSTR